MNDFSVKEAMEALQVSESTIRRMVKRGDFPNAYRQEQKIWIPQRDITAYLQRQQQSPMPEAIAESESPPPEVAAQTEPVRAEVVRPEPVLETQQRVLSEEERGIPERTPEVEPPPEEEPVKRIPPPVTNERRTMIPVIAQPIEELEPPSQESMPTAQTSTPPTPQPIYSRTEALHAYKDREQSFQWIFLQAGILSVTWIEQIFKSLRVMLENYKTKRFPEPAKTDEDASAGTE